MYLFNSAVKITFAFIVLEWQARLQYQTSECMVTSLVLQYMQGQIPLTLFKCGFHCACVHVGICVCACACVPTRPQRESCPFYFTAADACRAQWEHAPPPCYSVTCFFWSAAPSLAAPAPASHHTGHHGSTDIAAGNLLIFIFPG